MPEKRRTPKTVRVEDGQFKASPVAPQPAKVDIFAQIAAQRQSYRDSILTIPKPLPVPTTRFVLNRLNPQAVFTPPATRDTAAELTADLAELRRKMAPFLENQAPVLPRYRTIRKIESFNWRIQEEADKVDFQRVLKGDGPWTPVKIPHYGPPLGPATTFYRTEVNLEEADFAAGALFLCFKGVDYKARVYLNERCLGLHEGFFAPFHFDCTACARRGRNVLVVEVINDAICMGNNSWGTDGHLYEGDKIYAATGLGYDDAEVGWHHCPPGMGIYHTVTFEGRAPIHVEDLFVRPFPEEERAELWVELHNVSPLRQKYALSISVYGQNFKATVLEQMPFQYAGEVGAGFNCFRVPLSIPKPRIWDLDSPWLYQVQVTVVSGEGTPLDAQSRQFGMRSFRLDETGKPKGQFILNGRPLRLRGANTMGHEQQCVLKGDLAQLQDDLLLAKLCNLNFLRLTQRPVQEEVYEMCDRIGLMTQTDLPLFGVFRRNQFCEGVRQAQEMERLVRSHPCNILVTYINEPYWGADKTHRYLMRSELEQFFKACDQAVKLVNPDRVIKAVDGDYDPPAPEGLPDNHCYCGWYNGHGVPLGRLHRGYWQALKPGWNYGCGEFGSEGLDPENVMRKYYPPAWLPPTAEAEATWLPDRIKTAQTARFHYLWFDTQHSVADWVRASQAHQAWITRLMTEAFRRDRRMVSCAIHLFIDAFPSGWMKSIMDVDRQPKPAYFAYRAALAPLLAHLRGDRYAFRTGESAAFEAWICNDRNDIPRGACWVCQLEVAGKVVWADRFAARIPACSSLCQGRVRLKIPALTDRTTGVLRMAVKDSAGRILNASAITLDLFPRRTPSPTSPDIILGGSPQGPAAQVVRDLKLNIQRKIRDPRRTVVVFDHPADLVRAESWLKPALEQGARVVGFNLPEGEHPMFGERITVKVCGMGPVFFVSRDTHHPMVADFKPDDFKFWYDRAAGLVMPLMTHAFNAEGWTPILKSGNGGWQGEWGPALAAAEKPIGQGCLRICQVSLRDRTADNPVAEIFARRLLE